MKFLHVADLHIGKVVNDFSMLEDQRFILEQITELAVEQQVTALLLAGDIYDRAIPNGDAVALFDTFLTELTNQGISVIMISGNHDSPERISFGGTLLGRQGVHIAGVCKTPLTRVLMKESGVETEFVLLPFVKPAQIGAHTSQEAVSLLLQSYWEEEKEQTGHKKNRVLITHFFVTDGGREPELSDSETTIHVGGLDHVEASLFDGFDYVALGHIHKPQQIGNRPIWYAGSPLKYSFGEVNQTKSALLVELNEKGLGEVQRLPLKPLREMRKIKGTLEELQRAGEEYRYQPKLPGQEDYIQAILTDRGEVMDPIGALRSVYPNVMQIVREELSGTAHLKQSAETVRSWAGEKDALALFEAFYQEVRGEALSREGRQVMEQVVKELEGTEKP